MPKIADILSLPNPILEGSALSTGANTTSNDITSILVDSWVPWEEFTFPTLSKIFKNDLSSPYEGSSGLKPLPNDLEICNEATWEDVMRMFIVPFVNVALSKLEGQAHIGRGSQCWIGYQKVPDWSAVSPMYKFDDGKPQNCLPGDTKISTKFRPKMKDDPIYNDEWSKAISQEVTYMVLAGSRYGYIATEKHFVALRLAQRRIGSGLSQDRSQRQQATHTRQISDTAAIPDGSFDITTTDMSSEYSDHNPLMHSYEPPQYAVVNYSASGKDRLTYKSALFFLARMAMFERSIGYIYPALDSYRRYNKGFIHNTSGEFISKLGKHDKYEEPDVGETGDEGLAPQTSYPIPHTSYPLTQTDSYPVPSTGNYRTLPYIAGVAASLVLLRNVYRAIKTMVRRTTTILSIKATMRPEAEKKNLLPNRRRLGLQKSALWLRLQSGLPNRRRLGLQKSAS
ncbi:hypothetical protein GGR53DRAFT_484500 [Hypoxylon sp. FL1150]|nr:hypothetical protein GGR53DRAFT_484500 [Hypoxylon sp. FL1150]